MKIEKEKSVTVAAVLPESVAQDIERLAAENKVSKSFVIKMAIME